MTADTERRPVWWTRPSVMLPLVATIALFVALLSPQVATGRFGDPRLSSHLAGSLGARVLADVAQRLGWVVVKRDSVAAPLTADGRTIHAVLAPSQPLSAVEAHRYLESVRAGDALLLVLDGPSTLADSLLVRSYARGGILPSPNAKGAACPQRRDLIPSLWPDGKVHLLGLRWRRGAPPDRTVFATLNADDTGVPVAADAAAGIAYGKGRIAIVGDPDLLRNDVLRHCPWGADVIAVRILEWLRAGGDAPRTTLAFDEYHHGFGPGQGIFVVMAEFLASHPVGRTILQVSLAALVLLLAVAPQPIRPQPIERVERRDPLEQVDALAHAYEQVQATRTITARLLRGVRRRVERGGLSARSRTDDAFLDAAMARDPALSADVALVRTAIRDQSAGADLLAAGEALQRIEQTLTPTIA